MKEERYLKDREAIIRADIWKEITCSCKGLRTELGYTNVQIVDFLKEITKTFERDQLQKQFKISNVFDINNSK